MEEKQAKEIKAVEKALLDLALSGHYQALVFYLRNRCPARWSNSPETLELFSGNLTSDATQKAVVVIEIGGENLEV